MTGLPVAIEIPYRDPLAVFSLFSDQPYCAFLDSPEEFGRYAYIAVDPAKTFSAPHTAPENSWPHLQTSLAGCRLKTNPSLPPFQTGMVGYFGYEFGRHLERLPSPRRPGGTLPEFSVGLYDVIAAFDTTEKRGWVIASGYPETQEHRRVRYAERRACQLVDQIAKAPGNLPMPNIPGNLWRAEISRADYEAKVQRIIEYVRAGDIFQANLTQRFLNTKPAELRPFDLYRRL